MTDHELDHLLRRVLIDAIKLDYKTGDENNAPSFSPSTRYQRQIRLMLKDPLGWARKRGRPIWKAIIHRVAMILLFISLGFGAVMVVSPTARAAFVRWVTEWYETRILYWHMGDHAVEDIPKYEITELPEGFVEIECVELPELTVITYENEAGDVIDFSYMFISRGGASFYETDNAEVFDIEVNHMGGQFFELKIPEGLNTITWVDTEHNIQFDISSAYNYLDILHMAESVSLVEMTK